MSQSSRPVGYYLLEKFAEIYPGWVQHLKKDKEQKVRICTGYKNLLDDSITFEHIDALIDWLKSDANQEHRKWPPQALEVRPLIAMVQKKLKSAEPIRIPVEISATDGDSCVAKWVHRDLREIPPELSHLVPYVSRYQKRAETDRPFVGQCARLYLLGFVPYQERLKKQYPHLSDKEIRERFLQPKNQLPLMAEFGTMKRIQEMLDFMQETQICPDFCPPKEEPLLLEKAA